jgi:hypothetical protein
MTIATPSGERLSRIALVSAATLAGLLVRSLFAFIVLLPWFVAKAKVPCGHDTSAMRARTHQAGLGGHSPRFPRIFSRPFRLAENMSNSPRLPLNPTALALADAARALSQVSGQTITEEMIRADVASGAPTNADGTLNLVHYAAWLAKEMGRGD